MKGWAAAAGAVALAFALAPAPAAAKVGDEAWGKCVWATAPVEAARWLTMPLPSWGSYASLAGANVLLGYKLGALCDDTSVGPKTRSRSPFWKAMAAALRKSKPKTALPDAVSGAPGIFLCDWRADDEGTSHVYLHQVVRRGQLGESVAYEQYYTRMHGQSVKLPTDLSAVPPPGASTERSCRRIGSAGELEDA